MAQIRVIILLCLLVYIDKLYSFPVFEIDFHSLVVNYIVDHNNQKDTYYVTAGLNDTDGGSSATATFTTPGFKGIEHPEECLIFWYNINTNGIDDTLEVHKLDNDNGKVTNLWSLSSPGDSGWQEGRVQVLSDGDRMYQVSVIIGSIK